MTGLDIATRSHAQEGGNAPNQGTLLFAFVILGALAFPVVLLTSLANGLGLAQSGLVALLLSGPVALVVYLAIVLAPSRKA